MDFAWIVETITFLRDQTSRIIRVSYNSSYRDVKILIKNLRCLIASNEIITFSSFCLCFLWSLGIF